MMAERREPPRQAPETSGQQPEIKPVVDLLASILSEVQNQVLSKTPKPLEGAALRAVEQFREISAALALQRRPTITLLNDSPQGGTVTLRWSSTDAQTVSIDQEVGGVTTSLGELTPPAGGSKQFSGAGTTKFTATAKAFAPGLCTKTASVTVTLSP
jgi:hypothetical protein